MALWLLSLAFIAKPACLQIPLGSLPTPSELDRERAPLLAHEVPRGWWKAGQCIWSQSEPTTCAMAGKMEGTNTTVGRRRFIMVMIHPSGGQKKKRQQRPLLGSPWDCPSCCPHDNWKCVNGSTHLGSTTFTMHLLGKKPTKNRFKKKQVCAPDQTLWCQRKN